MLSRIGSAWLETNVVAIFYDSASTGPCLPFLGVHLMDLTKTDIGNPLWNADCQLNWGSNLSKVAQIINRIRSCVRDYFVSSKGMDEHLSFTLWHPPFSHEDDLCALSRKLEPKNDGKAN